MFDKRLFSLVPGAMRLSVASMALKVVGLLANVVMMMTIGFALQAIFTGGARVLGYRDLMVIAACIVVRAMANFAAQLVSNETALKAKKTIRLIVYDKLLRIGPSYAEKVSTAEAVQTAIEGSEQLEVFYGSFISQLLYAIIAPLVLFLALLPHAWVPALVMLVCVPLIPALIMMVMRKADFAAQAYWGSYVDLSSMFLEDIQGLTTLKIFRADAARHKKMNEQAEKFRRATMNMLGVQLRSIGMMDLVAYGSAALGIVVALIQFFQGSIPFASAFAAIFLAQEFFLPMRAVGSLFHAAMNGIAASKRMFRLLDVEEDADGAGQVPAGPVSIECRGIGYAYADGKEVLHDVDALFAGGEFSGIVGRSGAGKSTLAAIISGRARGYAGDVLVNGIDLRSLSSESLRSTITVVPSDGLLFKGTLRDNLKMAKSDATDGELIEVLDRCGMMSFVNAAGGLGMPIAEGSSNLSGGQRQRICMARALLHDTPVYVFDEATSNIDAESERVLGRIIEEMAQTHTVIAIAHRLSLVANADDIMVMDGGSIGEVGSLSELLERGGAFASLWETQQRLERLAARPDADAEIVDASEVSGNRASAAFPGGQRVADADRPATGKRSRFAIMVRLLKLVGSLKGIMARAITLGVLGFLAAIFLMVFAALAMMGIQMGTAALGLVPLCVLLAICGVARGPLRYGEQLSNHDIAFRILAKVRDALYSALRRLAPARLEKRDKGDLLSAATSDVELLEVFYAHTISPVVIAMLVSVAMLAFFGIHSLRLMLVALASYCAVGVALPLIASRVSASLGQALRDGQGEVHSFALESLRGLRELLQFGQAQQRSHELASRTTSLGKVELELNGRSALMSAAADVLIAALTIAMLQYALALASAGQIPLVWAFVCSMGFMSSFGPVVAIMRLGTTLQQTLASAARVLDILDEKPQTDDVVDGIHVGFSGLGVDDASFAYSGEREQVFRHVTLEVPKGASVCLTGENGAGKSTLLKLMMRFWDVDSGVVRFSEHDIRQVNTECLRAQEGYMTQETHLFAGTIAENIRIAKPDASEDELREACRKASVLELIESLPKGFDTQTGELGGSLSGGERQRIGLARIFLQDAALILLDEPTSNIDALNEAVIVESLDAFRKDKTIVLVSHRASTRALADRVLSLEQGRR